MRNVFYMHKISEIGGVESFFYYLAQLFDIEVYYTEGDIEQIKRLSQHCKVRKYTKPIKCDRFFSNYRCDVEFEAKEKYHIIHYDPLNVGFGTTYEKGWNYIGVSKVACKGFEKITGHKPELIYNVVPIKKKGLKKYPGLNLISCTRLTSEKGLNRMVKLSNMLDKAGVEYTWTIYTNKIRKARSLIESPNVIIKEQQLNLYDEIEKSNFLVQLSDCESFGLSVCESLILGTPVIITDLEAFTEIGCNETNSIKCNFEMTNVDIDKIVNGKFDFKYTPLKSEWSKYLDKPNYDPDEEIEVVCKHKYTDILKNEIILKGTKYKVSQARASYLESRDLIDICD